MLTLHGTVLNVFQTPEGKNKDGIAYGGAFKVQIQGKNILKNGQARIELLTLATDCPNEFSKLIGEEVFVEVGVFVSERRDLTFFLPAGSVPQQVA